MTSDNVFPDWLMSLVMFFDKTYNHCAKSHCFPIILKVVANHHRVN